MYNYLVSFVFGIVEGLTEWLPISSTAHLKLANYLFSLESSPAFYDLFEVVIQLGAIIAVIIILWDKIWPFGKSDNSLGNKGILSLCKKDKFILWIKIAISCMPVIVYKLFIEDYVNFVNDNNEMTIIGYALIGVGIIFLIVEAILKNKKASKTNTDDITYIDALIIGLIQLVAAIVPGVSRSGSTIITGLILGLSRSSAMLYTYELAIPVMAGASLMEVLDYGFNYSLNEVVILGIGCLTAFVVSILVIRIFLDYIKKNGFSLIAIYRILIGIVILLFIA